MLLRNIPIKICADVHNTSTGQIEKHYGRFILRHADDLVRAVLIDTSPPSSPGKVLALRP
jgi:hypothetical protein